MRRLSLELSGGSGGYQGDPDAAESVKGARSPRGSGLRFELDIVAREGREGEAVGGRGSSLNLPRQGWRPCWNEVGAEDRGFVTLESGCEAFTRGEEWQIQQTAQKQNPC